MIDENQLYGWKAVGAGKLNSHLIDFPLKTLLSNFIYRLLGYSRPGDLYFFIFITSVFLPLFGLILSIRGLKKEKSSTLAIIGIILGLSILMISIFFSHNNLLQISWF